MAEREISKIGRRGAAQLSRGCRIAQRAKGAVRGFEISF